MRDVYGERWQAWQRQVADPSSEAPRIFTKLLTETASAEVMAAQARQHGGTERGPLDGTLISVKDLFDVRGTTTTAGSRLLQGGPAASVDAPVVARFREAGAVIVGKTAMTEFAYSGVGWNPHYGTPANPFDRAVGRLPGGSSSGAAVSVADGLADVGLATDTGGSVRIPAALCGLVGWKPTARRVPQGGMVPLSPSLDAVGVIAATLARCIEADRVIADQPLAVRPAPPAGELRLGVLQGLVMRDLEPEVAEAYAQALAVLGAAGVTLVDIELSDVDDCSRQGIGARIVAHEAFAYHRTHLPASRSLFDPRVLRRIEAGADIGVDDYRAALALRSAVIESTGEALGGLQGWLMPTVPITAPPIAACESDEEFFRINGMLLRNPAMVNFLDGCAITLPCPMPSGHLPVGISLAGLGGRDADILAAAGTLDALLQGGRREGEPRRP